MPLDARLQPLPAPAPRPSLRRALTGAALALACGALAGCGDLSLDLPYYWQSIGGQLALTQQARPIAELLEGDEVDARVRPKLRRALEIRDFASRELALPGNGSYRRYADLRRPFVVWNVYATPELSMQLKQWCFPVAGCVTYRGYFDREAAELYARSLRDQGWEAYVSGVPAYSTLGWFDDPVLNTFVHYPDGELARLIFHELAHQVVYLKGDSTFNESFATAVEEAGVERWLQASGDPALETGYQAFAERRRQFVALLRRHKAALEEVYRRPGSDEEKRAGKAAVFEALQADYRVLKAQWGGYAGYDRWFGQKLTNAHLASVATYNAQVPGFRRLLAQGGGDLPTFYAQVKALSKRDKAERDRVLDAGAP